MSKKESFKIFHVASWNIFNILFCHVELIYDMATYFMPCHGIFFHVTYMINCGINNDLLTLSILTFLVQPMFQMSRALLQYF